MVPCNKGDEDPTLPRRSAEVRNVLHRQSAEATKVPRNGGDQLRHRSQITQAIKVSRNGGDQDPIAEATTVPSLGNQDPS